jgi:hypothetical protein
MAARFEPNHAKVLTAVFELMLNAGVGVKTLEGACVASLRRAEAQAKTGRDEAQVFITAGLVLDAWHRDRRYLNKGADPKPVPLFGRAPSVEALVRAQRLGRQAAAIARRLKELQLVIPNGRGAYFPASDVAVISAEHPLVVQHAARALSTLLETVGRNMSGARRLAPLIERIAEVPDLPQEHVEAFEKFTRLQGKIFIRTVNDWLESRRRKRTKRRSPTPTVRAGVHTYAYVAGQPRRVVRAARS